MSNRARQTRQQKYKSYMYKNQAGNDFFYKKKFRITDKTMIRIAENDFICLQSRSIIYHISEFVKLYFYVFL